MSLRVGQACLLGNDTLTSSPEFNVAVLMTNQVQSDPAVRKAGREALEDTSRALASIGRFGAEVRNAWYRSQPHGGVIATPA